MGHPRTQVRGKQEPAPTRAVGLGLPDAQRMVRTLQASLQQMGKGLHRAAQRMQQDFSLELQQQEQDFARRLDII